MTVPTVGSAGSASLLLVSDTHVPVRAKDLPAPLWAAVESLGADDLVVHAGDWMDPGLLDALEARAPRVVGVWGNNDGPELRERLPEVARFEVGGLRFAVTHETGAAQGRERRMAARFPDVDVLVFGHSHIPWDTTASRPDNTVASRPDNTVASRPEATAAPTGLRLLNPGSPTDRRRQPTHTWMTATVQEGELRRVDLVHLEDLG
ncbi:metallophosphoesterase [Pseudonocardia kujensis]|uniref:metallophosphoesterase family protein n=1 Tax=Pseudonocardia kujensis TaxID=1128675 RepID=UPI001E5EEBFF|nr:metallophosphoesterase [Pseudonocardia kujensis]MCE0766606.1 metallophosphoesterase [Pseudonocardia kujensis]